MRPKILAILVTGLLLFAVTAPPLTGARAAAVKTELVIDQLQAPQIHLEKSMDLAPLDCLYLTTAYDVAYLSWDPAPVLAASMLSLDGPSPVPKDELATFPAIKIYKHNRMKNSK